MSRKEDIDVAVWSDPDFADLGAAAKLLYLWSFTNQRCGMAGIYKVPRRAILLETSLTDDQLAEALAELEEQRFVYYDGTWLWVRSRVKHLRTRTVQMCRGVAKDLAAVPEEHAYLKQLLAADGGSVWASGNRATTILGELEDLESVASDSHPDSPGYHPQSPGSKPNSKSHKGTSQRFLGKGKGYGKGSLGREGAGERDDAAAEKWATENFPDQHPTEVLYVARQVHADGVEVTVESVTERMSANQRALEAA